MKHRRKHSRRRFHRNPSFARKGGGGGAMGGTFKTAALGAAGILVNNLVSNQLGSFLGSASIAGASPKTIVKVALPLVAGMTIGRRNQAIKAASAVALAAALVEILKPMLPASLGLAGTADYLPAGIDIYRDGFRPVASMQGYTDSIALPSSIAN